MKDLKYLGTKTGKFIGDNNDFIIIAGDLSTVDAVDRLKQDVIKILLTPYTIRPYVNYGSILPTIKDTRITDTSLPSTITDDIITSLKYLDLGEPSGVDSERLAAITKLTAEFTVDSLNIALIIRNKAGDQFNLSFEV